jgi:hypothetical protein
MKNENNETRLVSAFNVRRFAAGLLIMAAAWGVSLIGSLLIWSHGGSGVAQAMLSIGLLTVFPLGGALGFASCAWRAVGVRRRMLASVSLGFVAGGILLTGFMLADANRLAAVEAVFVLGNIVE